MNTGRRLGRTSPRFRFRSLPLAYPRIEAWAAGGQARKNLAHSTYQYDVFYIPNNPRMAHWMDQVLTAQNVLFTIALISSFALPPKMIDCSLQCWLY